MEFLNKIASEIFEENKRDYTDTCIVFPHKRAGLFFKKELAQKSEKPVWSPNVFSINEFVSELSNLSLSDHLTMIFELYCIFTRFGGNESFEKFYQWGCLMLNDFNEIDRHLVDEKKIFRNLKELKDIQNEFQFNAADNEYFRNFWQTFSNTPLNESQEAYVNMWDNMGKVFSEFRKVLLEKNLAYEGLMYSELCRKLDNDEVSIPWKKVIFAGFNLITPAELNIMKAINSKAETSFYWNTDEYFHNDRKQEAGHFLRKNIVELDNQSQPKWIDNNLAGKVKDVSIIGVPLKAGQAKALSGELSSLIKSGNFDPEKTVIIIPDEILLMPLLYSLPSSLKDVNVTMGYPFKLTPVYNFIQLLQYIQSNCYEHTDKNINYYYKDIIRLLSHPYIKKLIGSERSDRTINEILENNLVYIQVNELKEMIRGYDELLDNIFGCKGDALTIIEKLRLIFDKLSEPYENKEELSAKFEVQYFFCLYTSLINLKKTLERYKEKVNINEFWNLYLDILKEVKVPFTGEPLKGLQIMGLLEARNLDFENVFILSLNEGVMPASGSRTSLIPFNIRKSFKMPVFEDDDAVNANYFYSVISRAKNVYLLYDTQEDEFLAGDVSRYILQIDKELAQKSDKIKLHYKIGTFEYSYPAVKDIRITKTDKVLEKIKTISATQLNTYINCPLQFYLRMIAGVKEEIEMEEIYSPATFGLILHKIMQGIYENAGEVTAEFIERVLADVKDPLKFNDIFSKGAASLRGMEASLKYMRGQNYLFRQIIQRLVKDILERDMQDAPFTIAEIECKVSREIPLMANGKTYNVTLKGVIDRVDIKDGIYRIIDYKTGNPNPKFDPKKSFNDNIDIMFDKVEKKEQLQTMFYSFLYKDKIYDGKLKSGVYAMRKVKDGVIFSKEEPYTNEEFEYFRDRLDKILVSIYDRSNNFIQTEDINNCNYCSFRSFCYR